MAARSARADDAEVGALPSSGRRGVACLALAAIAVLPSACGGSGDAAAATSTTAAGSCGDQLVAWAGRSDVKALAVSGAPLKGDAKSAFDSLQHRCGATLDALSDTEAERVIARIDPVVVDYLSASATTTFEKTGHAISDG